MFLILLLLQQKISLYVLNLRKFSNIFKFLNKIRILVAVYGRRRTSDLTTSAAVVRVYQTGRLSSHPAGGFYDHFIRRFLRKSLQKNENGKKISRKSREWTHLQRSNLSFKKNSRTKF